MHTTTGIPGIDQAGVAGDVGVAGVAGDDDVE